MLFLAYLDLGILLLLSIAVSGVSLVALKTRVCRQRMVLLSLACLGLALTLAVTFQFYDFYWYPKHFHEAMPFYDYWEMKWIGYTLILGLIGCVSALFGRGRVRICLALGNVLVFLSAFADAAAQ